MTTVTVEPHVEVRDVPQVVNLEYGSAGKIALIGAFPSKTFKIDLFTTADAAKAGILSGTDYKDPSDTSAASADKTDVPDTYKAYYALDYIFASNRVNKGPESVVIVNTNFGKTTLVQASSNADILAATVILAEEDFDILTVAEPIVLEVSDGDEGTELNPIFTTLKSFVDTQYTAQKPFGIITGIDLTGATTTKVTDFKNLFKDKGIFKAVTTKVKLNGDAASLSIEQSGCWHAAYTSGRPVNKSETAKVYADVIGENSKDVYPATATVNFNNLREAGFHTTRFRNRRLQTVECISNITPAMYDMKVERVKNYIIKRFTLRDYLGEDHTGLTKNQIKGMFQYEKQLAMQAGYITDMEYDIISVDEQTVKAQLVLYIPEVLRVIKLDVAVKISNEFEGA